MNWVDKKYAKEHNILIGAPELWQKVQTAIEDAVNSFAQQLDTPDVSSSTENGHAIVVKVSFPPEPYPGMPNGIPRVNIVRIIFDDRRNLITAVLNQKTPAKFPIEADEKESFLTYEGERISPDRLSELALSDAFYKTPKAITPAHIRHKQIP